MEYLLLFNTCVIKTEKLAEVDKVIDEKVVPNRWRYDNVSSLVKMGSNSFINVGNKNLFASSYTPFFDRFSTTPTPQNIATVGATQALTSSQPIDTVANLTAPNFGSLAGSSFFDSSKFLTGDFLSTYNRFSTGGSIPWYFIACVHYMECSFSFNKHLHNGDPLTGYTVQVPAGRPKVGHAPPFTFEESAVDALKLMKYDTVTNWSLPFILQKLEGYNGFGYAKKGINTPYLWSYSNQYTKGKYVKDGVFSAEAVSAQMGAAVILKRMEDRGLISIPRN